MRSHAAVPRELVSALWSRDIPLRQQMLQNRQERLEKGSWGGEGEDGSHFDPLAVLRAMRSGARVFCRTPPRRRRKEWEESHETKVRWVQEPERDCVSPPASSGALVPPVPRERVPTSAAQRGGGAVDSWGANGGQRERRDFGLCCGLTPRC